VHDALVDPDRDTTRQLLKLSTDEQRPKVLEAVRPQLVVWSSIWTQRPDAVIRFDLFAGDSGDGTDLMWTLLVEEPEPHAASIRHLCKRVNELINAELRYSFGL